ncbi:MAG: energy transducer TonB [Bacteroidaceae bacterium]|nr:energy transducer TonB [Bacteroidaceae bacterium]
MEYILKSAVVLASLYTLFYFFLKKETFHRFNRVCLIFTLMASLVLPMVHITVSQPTAVNQAVMASTTYVTALPTIVVTPKTKAPLLTWNDVLAYIYWIGLCIMLLYLALQIVQTYLLIKGGLRHTDEFGNTVILKDDVKSPFSIFHYIVMSVEDYEKHRRNILTHEQEHIRMCHSYDLLLLEIVKVLQWFNPFVWFLENDLKALHEYQADEAVINQGIDAKQYQQLLVVKAVGNRLQPFANNLRRGSLKKRIIMMYQKKSNRWMMLKALFIIPMTCFAIYAFANSEANEQVPKVKKTVAAQQEKTTPDTLQNKTTSDAQQMKTVTVVTKCNKEILTGTTSKEKAEQMKKDIEAKFGDNVTVSLTDVDPNDSIVNRPSKLAQYPGGYEAAYQFMSQILKYPQIALEHGIQGRVSVQFVVNKDGSVCDVTVVSNNANSNVEVRDVEGEKEEGAEYITLSELNSARKALEEEAIRVVKAMPKWEPAEQDGKKVRSRFMLPMSFRLN